MPLLRSSLAKTLAGLAGLASEADVFLAGAGLGGPVAFKVQLALEECIRNIIEHAGGSPETPIQVQIQAGPDRVVIVLEDDGQPFDPGSAPAFDPARELAGRAPNGMGVHLLRSLMDEIHYERLGSTNRLRLVVAR